MDNAMNFTWAAWLADQRDTPNTVAIEEIPMPWWLAFDGEDDARPLLRVVAAVLEAVVTELVPEWPETVCQLAEQVMDSREAPLSALIALASVLEGVEDRSTAAGMLRLVGLLESAMETGRYETDWLSEPAAR